MSASWCTTCWVSKVAGVQGFETGGVLFVVVVVKQAPEYFVVGSQDPEVLGGIGGESLSLATSLLPSTFNYLYPAELIEFLV